VPQGKEWEAVAALGEKRGFPLFSRLVGLRHGGLFRKMAGVSTVQREDRLKSKAGKRREARGEAVSEEGKIGEVPGPPADGGMRAIFARFNDRAGGRGASRKRRGKMHREVESLGVNRCLTQRAAQTDAVCFGHNRRRIRGQKAAAGEVKEETWRGIREHNFQRETTAEEN